MSVSQIGVPPKHPVLISFSNRPSRTLGFPIPRNPHMGISIPNIHPNHPYMGTSKNVFLDHRIVVFTEPPANDIGQHMFTPVKWCQRAWLESWNIFEHPKIIQTGPTCSQLNGKSLTINKPGDWGAQIQGPNFRESQHLIFPKCDPWCKLLRPRFHPKDCFHSLVGKYQKRFTAKKLISN